MLVFVNGNWETHDVPVGCDPTWSQDDRVLYVIVMGKLRAAAPKLSVMRCEQIAEAYVSKQRYPGTTFDSDIETALAWFQRRA
jgi:hypothetical protein